MEELRRLREQLEAVDRLDLASLDLRSFSGLSEREYGFFPGGNGLYDGHKASKFPHEGALILGSNFGSVEMLDREGNWKSQDERNGPTWTPLLKTLKQAGIDRGLCFFTNAWPFLHKGDGNVSQMISRWLSNKGLNSASVEFFKESLLEVRPRLIIALGTGPAAFLGNIWPERLGKWRQRSWKYIDEKPLETINDLECRIVCVALTHPSMPNRWHRREEYRNLVGEARLVSEAAIRAGMPTRSENAAAEWES